MVIVKEKFGGWRRIQKKKCLLLEVMMVLFVCGMSPPRYVPLFCITCLCAFFIRNWFLGN